MKRENHRKSLKTIWTHFIIPKIHRKKHVWRPANVHRIVVVQRIENVNIAVVARSDEIVFVKLDTDRSGAARARFLQGTRLESSNVFQQWLLTETKETYSEINSEDLVTIAAAIDCASFDQHVINAGATKIIWERSKQQTVARVSHLNWMSSWRNKQNIPRTFSSCSHAEDQSSQIANRFAFSLGELRKKKLKSRSYHMKSI